VPTLTTNQWYHVVGTFNGSVINLYIDGVLDATSSKSGKIGASDGVPLRLGCRGTGTGLERYLEGVLDQVAIYPRCLTAEQIYQHYLESKDGFSSNSQQTYGVGGYPAANSNDTSASYMANTQYLPPVFLLVAVLVAFSLRKNKRKRK